MIAGREPVEAPEEAHTPQEGAARARELLEQGLSPSGAAKQAAQELGLKKSQVYALLVEDSQLG